MKSFVDLLFILLCGTIVMLSRSLQVGSLEMAPAKVGSGGISEVRADEVQLVAVGDESLAATDDAGEQVILNSVEELKKYIGEGRSVLLSAVNEDVSHHRIMGVWSRLCSEGVSVKLAAVKESRPDDRE